jgi:predicted kinase
LIDRAWRGFLLGLMTLFVVNIGLMIAAVATSSFAPALARHLAARRLDHDVVHRRVEGIPVRGSGAVRQRSRSCSLVVLLSLS